MKLKALKRITDEDFEIMGAASDKEIVIDIKDVDFLSSKEITKLVILHNKGKKIELFNVNSYIAETIHILKIGNILEIK
ncbi:MAG: hypothetical protein KAT05_02425 [Spirochaetes bacterium]|nr:hypothetical protein [Spirochaetota bacterium]